MITLTFTAKIISPLVMKFLQPLFFNALAIRKVTDDPSPPPLFERKF
jgi:hypothetical protein